MKKISILLILILTITLISPVILAQDLENIETEQKDGEKVLILTESQYIALADYIEEVETENDKLTSQLEQAKEEVDKAYENDNAIDFSGLGGALSGAAIATLLINLTK